jgi:predicted ATPase
MPASEEFDTRPVRAFRPDPGGHVDESVWPASVPAMAQLLREGLELPAGLTVLVGENGSGKSTLVECLAEAYGLNPQGGSVQGRLFQVRDSEPGFYLMDEPDAPLSFVASLGLAALLHDLAAAGSQMVVATHSPVIAAIPGAHLLELGPWGMRPSAWEDLSLVIAWRHFMRDPHSYFRHLFAEL